MPTWGWALITGGFVWVLYVLTLAPDTAFWDTSEYIATAYILGLPHPPGNPFFVLLGRTWILLLGWTGLGVAARVNLLSATASAGAAAIWFLTVARIWSRFTADRTKVLVASGAAVLVSATAFTVWAQSNVNEKVYTVSLLFVALVSYVAVLWQDHADRPSGDRLVVLIAFLLGLGATNHQMSIMPLLALGVYVLWHRWRTILRWRLVLGGLAFALIGFSVQLLFVPIRSARNPVIDEADPQCESLWDAVTPSVFETFNGKKKLLVRCDALAASMAREQYQKGPLSERQSPLKAQVANYRQYFDWQWARSLPPVPRMIVTLVFFALGILGLLRHRRGDPHSFGYFATLLLTVSVLLIYYLNFKYGYSQYPEIPTPLHEVRERDYFYILSFNLWGLYAGLGIASLWSALAGRLEMERAGGHRAGRLAAPVLGVALLPLLFNFSYADRRGDYSARDWAYNLLESVEPYGVLFTNGDNDTFPLWYLQEVEGVRQDVTVIVHSYLGTKWYAKQLRELTRPCPEGVDPRARPSVAVCQRPFDTEAAIEPYRDMTPRAPTRSILSLNDEQIDRVPNFSVVPAGFEVPFSDHIRISFPTDTVVTHPDLLAYRIIRDSLGDRPVYFASTAPPVYQHWALQPYLLRQGLAHKLIDGVLESTTDTVELGAPFDVRWIDRKRTETLLWDVFQLEYLLGWERWPEPSTRASIPSQYYLAHVALGEAYRLRELPEDAQRNYDRGTALLRLAGPLLGSAEGGQ
ncbi:MAG: DUF2723 domain-containing protein [Gemmatimonadota bacterium]